MAVDDPAVESRTVGAVERTCDLITALQERDGAGVTELANALELSPGAVHCHLATLRKKELVTKEGQTYRLSLRFLDIGEYVKNRVPDIEFIQDELEQLADETGTRAQFVVEERGIGISVAIARSNGTVVPTTRIGMETHLHSSSCGKAILAHLPDERVEWILDYRGLPEKTPDTITDREALREELETVREENVAFNDEERLKGLRAVGVPVRSPDGTVFGSVSVSGTRSRLDDEMFYDELPAVIGNTANILEINAQI